MRRSVRGLIAGFTALCAVVTPIVIAAAGTPGSDASSGSWVGGLVFTGPFEPLVLWRLPGSGGRLGTCIDANSHGPLRGPYTKRASISDPLYGELNHLYGRSDVSDVQLAELSALNSHKYDHVDRNMQWSYLVNHRGGTSVSGADAMLARAKTLAGPYSVALSWPAGDTATNTAYTATITVTSSSGNAVPGAIVTLTGTNVTLATHSVTTNSSGHAVVGFRIPDGTSTSFTIAAAVQSWTTVDVYGSPGEQQMLVSGTPSTQRGQRTGLIHRVRTVDLVKVAAHDATHTPVPGYTYEISDAGGHVVLPSITTGRSASDAPLGPLTVGATYHARELSVPPGAPLYIPDQATMTFVVPPGTTTWTLMASDPEIPTPAITTKVTLQNGIVGQRLIDDVIVSGNDGEKATIAATLYGPVSPPPSGVCGDLTLGQFTAATKQHLTATVDGSVGGGNGTYRISGPVASTPGCWGWGETLTLSPSGATATSPPTAATESTLVTAPKVSTTVSAQVAAVGFELTDKVEVSGLNGQRANMIATLYGPLPGDPLTGCTKYSDDQWRAAIARLGSSLVAATTTVDVAGDGSYVTTPVRLTRVGCYTYSEVLTPASTPTATVVTPLGAPAESTVVVTPAVHTVAAANSGAAGATIRDHLTVTGTYGTAGSVTGELLGPLAAHNGACAGLDWTSAKVAATLAPITVAGDGDYDTAAVTITQTGCYTFVESLILAGVPTPFVRTPPGLPTETVLAQRSTHVVHRGPELARTGVRTVMLGGVGAAAVGAGLAICFVGRRRRRL